MLLIAFFFILELKQNANVVKKDSYCLKSYDKFKSLLSFS